MKRILYLAVILIGILQLNAQDNYIEDKWLVILSGFDNRDQAEKAQQENNFETTILNSGDYDNLNPGWYINCFYFKAKTDAQTRSKQLKEKGINNYIKYSGKYKNRPNYIQENHYLVFGNKYLLTDHIIEPEKILKVIGTDSYDGTHIAKASIAQSDFPEQIKYLASKQFKVYDIHGNEQLMKIKSVSAVNISNPYWGFVMQWQEQELSDIEKAKELIGMGKLQLALELDFEDEFEGVLAVLDNVKGLSVYSQEEELIEKAFEAFENSEQAKEIDLMLRKLMDEEEAYEDMNEFPIYQDAKQFSANGKSYVLFNVIYGDYCESQKYGIFYNNIFGIWSKETNTIEILDNLNWLAQFDFYPLVIESDGKPVYGFLTRNYGGMNTYFKDMEWKNYKSLEIWTHECD